MPVELPNKRLKGGSRMRRFPLAAAVLFGSVLATACDEVPTAVDHSALSPSAADLSVRSGETFSNVRITSPSNGSASLAVGGSQQMAAALFYSRGGRLPGAPYTQWRSADDCVATVTSASPSWGMVRGISAGTTQIIAEAWGRADTVTVRVTGAGNLDASCADRQWLWDYNDASFTATRIRRNTVQPGEVVRSLVLFAGPRPDYTISRGGKVTLRAEMWYSRGGKLIANSFASFTSTDGSVATVTSTGVVTGRSSGRTKIIARLGQFADTVPLYVR
jgi:hypothetical protein